MPASARSLLPAACVKSYDIYRPASDAPHRGYGRFEEPLSRPTLMMRHKEGEPKRGCRESKARVNDREAIYALYLFLLLPALMRRSKSANRQIDKKRIPCLEEEKLMLLDRTCLLPAPTERRGECRQVHEEEMKDC